LSLSIFFTTPESSWLALAVVPLGLDDAWLVEVWLEGVCVWPIEDDGLCVCDGWLGGVCAVGLVEVEVELCEVELCCSALALVTPTNPAAAMPMRSVFISFLLLGEWTTYDVHRRSQAAGARRQPQGARAARRVHPSQSTSAPHERSAMAAVSALA